MHNCTATNFKVQSIILSVFTNTPKWPKWSQIDPKMLVYLTISVVQPPLVKL